MAGRTSAQIVLAEAFLATFLPGLRARRRAAPRRADARGRRVRRALTPEGGPAAIIFVTAHDEYALKAFDVEAVDYLLKPFDRRRFNEALRRARKRIESGALPLPKDWTAVLEELARRKDPGGYWSRFVVRERDRMILVPVADVDWIAAEGKYVRLHTGMPGSGSHLLRASMSEVESHLDPSDFARIHRGTIVNWKKVAEMYRGFGTNSIVVLGSGHKLTLSRRYRSRLKNVGGMA